MSDDYVPDRQSVLEHAATLELTVMAINATGAFMAAPEGTPEEDQAREVLFAAMEVIGKLSPDEVGDLVMSMATILCACAPDGEVQSYLDFQSNLIQKALS